MSTSYTLSETTTFTVTHAKHMAAKIAADLKRLQRLYGKPSDASIGEYETEAIALMKAGYLDTVSYGWKRNGSWIEPTLRYTARDLAGSSSDSDDPGKVRSGADIDGAGFTSFLTYSSKWSALSSEEKTAFKKNLPFFRGAGEEPSISGYLESDRTYAAGGRALDRASVRSFG